MKSKILVTAMLAIGLTACSGSYEFYPDAKKNQNINVESLSVEGQSITVKGQSSTLSIKSLEEKVGPWTAPRLEFKIRNDTQNRIMKVKASDLKVGFTGFLFDVVEYKIIQKDRPEELSFINNDNFKYEHEVLPQEEIVIQATFKTPKSQESYTNKTVLIQTYTNLDVFDVSYKIKKTRK